MKIVELILLVICYSSLLIALFLEIICYSKNIESKITIAFTLSLLLFVVSMSISPLVELKFGTSAALTSSMVCLVFVSVTTFRNILNERKHKVPKLAVTLHLVLGGILLILSILGYIFQFSESVNSAVIVYLLFSVLLSMLIVFRTDPKKQYAHLEKVERRFALAFMVVVPVVVIFSYWFEEQYSQLQIGFMVPVIFILLASNKIYDDLKRLSIIQSKLEPKKQKFKNFNFTKREEEIASLLFEGHTYTSISEQLFISLPTVKTHASNVYKKCNVKNKHELILLLMS
ncbi:MAG: helix-turn-helix transcriptional regulator [Flavobacteriales bacterium]|nr:helix-turn-helix transcriptional regulator [Flavobacteriales bacterium]